METIAASDLGSLLILYTYKVENQLLVIYTYTTILEKTNFKQHFFMATLTDDTYINEAKADYVEIIDENSGESFKFSYPHSVIEFIEQLRRDVSISPISIVSNNLRAKSLAAHISTIRDMNISIMANAALVELNRCVNSVPGKEKAGRKLSELCNKLKFDYVDVFTTTRHKLRIIKQLITNCGIKSASFGLFNKVLYINSYYYVPFETVQELDSKLRCLLKRYEVVCDCNVDVCFVPDYVAAGRSVYGLNTSNLLTKLLYEEFNK